MARSPKGDEAIQIKNMLCLDCFASLAVTNHVLPQHRDQAMQRLRGDVLVLHHGDANVVRAGIAAVRLFAREIAARHDT